MRCWLGLAVVLAGCAMPSPRKDGPGAKVDRYLARLQKIGFSGAVLVARNGEVILEKGYGFADRERRIPITPDTVFTVGSITKQFTAAAILKLEMQGKLRVTDRIGKHLPGVPEDKAGITLHHLLTHSAGLMVICHRARGASHLSRTPYGQR